MIITLCGSIKFFDEMDALRGTLEELGHAVHMPVRATGVDYWADDGTSRIEAKRGLNLISKHLDKIQKSDAILVANITKGDITNYVGANTFLEIGFAHHQGKRIYLLNDIPDQPYILDELVAVNPVVLNGDLAKIA